MNRFDPPALLQDLDEAGKAAWSELVSAWFDRSQAGDPDRNDGPRGQFFNPLKKPIEVGAAVAEISWTAFPAQVKASSVSDKQRWRRADSSRDLQDEYCEWSVTRDPASNKIIRVTFTCEGPEYWEHLAQRNPQKLVELYRRHVSASIQVKDLFQGGVYRKRNPFNNSVANGAMHLIQAANSLTAEIELAAAATIRRMRNDQEITDAQELIRCSLYGEPTRNSDPHIGEQVNALARQGADITLQNPIGLYMKFENPGKSETPDGKIAATEFWKITRGSEKLCVRAVFEVPPSRGYLVGDIKIDGRPIEFGGQIADFITMSLIGVATRIGQSTVKTFNGCKSFADAGDVSSASEVPPPLPTRLTAGIADGPVETEAPVFKMPEALEDEASQADAAAALLKYPHLPAELFKPRLVSGKIFAYASPDSTFAVTKKLLESARRSIVIGIYDFGASYVKDILKDAMRRSVSVSLMLDTNSSGENKLMAELSALGARCVKAPSRSAGNPNKYFGNAHEKIIVVDRRVVMIQSGNWSENSIPFNELDGKNGGHFQPGNRDMGLAVESAELAEFFADLVLRDMRLSEGAPVGDDIADAVAETGLAPLDPGLFFEAAPTLVPAPLFPSIVITPSSPVPITPAVTPENFHSVAKDLLKMARRSVRIEQQYIRNQPDVTVLMDEIAKAKMHNPSLLVRIIVSPKYLDGNDRKAFLTAMAGAGLEFDENFRFLSAAHFVHCHNKLIVVDEETTLLGSQNWSTTGVLTNREASLLVELPAVATYFAGIFDADWEMSEPGHAPLDTMLDEAASGIRYANDFASGGVVISSASDYANT